MTVNEKKKIKTADNKIEQNKAQYGVDTQAATMNYVLTVS